MSCVNLSPMTQAALPYVLPSMAAAIYGTVIAVGAANAGATGMAVMGIALAVFGLGCFLGATCLAMDYSWSDKIQGAKTVDDFKNRVGKVMMVAVGLLTADMLKFCLNCVINSLINRR